MVPTDFPLLHWGFIALTAITLFAFYWLTGKKTAVLITGATWLALTALIANTGFFLVTDTLPPRIAILLIPMLIGGLLIGFGKPGAGLRTTTFLGGLHYFHSIRIVVELVFLRGLYKAGFIAKTMTYEGLNYDIVPGILLPIIGLLVFRFKVLPKGWAVAANVLGIAVLSWTVATAVLSAPTPFQVFSPEQPTVAILHFPFVWLPALVAPLMFWAHFISLRLLVSEAGGGKPIPYVSG